MKLGRRIILRGFGGAAIGLPLLEATHGRALAQARGPRRFIVFFEHGGTISASQKSGRRYDGSGRNNGVDGWAPKSPAGQPLVLGPIHEPLAPFASDLVILRGVNNTAGARQSPYNGDHGWANVTALTSAVATKSGDSTSAEGPSIDAVLAERLNQRTRVPFPLVSLYLPAHNYGTPFFRGPRQPSRGEVNPVAAFDKLFAGVSTGGATGPDPAALRARALRKSVLDGVGEGLKLFEARVSARDRQAVAAHLEHIRAIERQLSSITVSAACTKPSVAGLPAKVDQYSVDIEKSGPVEIDILVAALRCGLTNVATFEIGDFYAKFLAPTFPAAYNIGHSLHHAARDVGKTGPDASRFPAWLDTMLRSRQWRMKLFARFLEGLKATPEGAGTMLDGSLILYTSEFSCGSDHSVADVPTLLAGKAGGRLRAGRHVNYNLKAAANPATLDYETKASFHNLYTSILNLFDYPDTHFGSNGHAFVTGPLPDLA
jgi:hypothetical protein